MMEEKSRRSWNEPSGEGEEETHAEDVCDRGEEDA
jgi:hypothetical protein